MKTRIKAVVYVVVYESAEDGMPGTFEDAGGWVEAALYRGDKHASSYSASLDKVHSIELVEDDE